MRARTKRRSNKQKEFLQTLAFFLVTILSITGLIAYLWVYTEIDETLIALEIQNSTVNDLLQNVQELQSDIEYLTRADVISTRARRDLNMVVAQPETIVVFINPSLLEKTND